MIVVYHSVIGKYTDGRKLGLLQRFFRWFLKVRE